VLSEDHRVPLSPDVFRGLVALLEEAQPGPGTGAGGSEAREKAYQRTGVANFAKAVATCS
jgi:hypothetical protein